MPFDIDDLRAALPNLSIPDQQPKVGGQRCVYRATDPSQTEVAVKILKEPIQDSDDEFAQADQQAVERYRRELDMLRQIDSPYVVKVFGEPQPITLGGQSYLVHLEPYYETSLAQRIAEGNLASPDECARLVRDLFRALRELSDLGIVHRDIKPQNVMLDDQGRPVLVDFGIAFLSNRTRVTRTAAWSPYTWLYFAPEQMDRGLAPDFRTDQFLVALCAFVFAAGTHPFIAPNEAEYIEAVRNGADKQVLIAAGISVCVADLILRCMGAHPNQRYRSAAVALTEIENCIGVAG